MLINRMVAFVAVNPLVLELLQQQMPLQHIVQFIAHLPVDRAEDTQYVFLMNLCQKLILLIIIGHQAVRHIYHLRNHGYGSAFVAILIETLLCRPYNLFFSFKP